MDKFKVIVAGSRDFNNYNLLKLRLDNILKEKSQNSKLDIEIVSGTAKGADSLGEDYAREKGYSIKPFPADWTDMTPPCLVRKRFNGDLYNALAGNKRNKLMGDYADALVAFWDGKSTGTKDMIDIANSKGIPVRIIRY